MNQHNATGIRVNIFERHVLLIFLALALPMSCARSGWYGLVHNASRAVHLSTKGSSTFPSGDTHLSRHPAPGAFAGTRVPKPRLCSAPQSWTTSSESPFWPCAMTARAFVHIAYPSRGIENGGAHQELRAGKPVIRLHTDHRRIAGAVLYPDGARVGRAQASRRFRRGTCVVTATLFCDGCGHRGDAEFADHMEHPIRPVIQLFTPAFSVMVGLSLDFRTIDWSSSYLGILPVIPSRGGIGQTTAGIATRENACVRVGRAPRWD